MANKHAATSAKRTNLSSNGPRCNHTAPDQASGEGQNWRISVARSSPQLFISEVGEIHCRSTLVDEDVVYVRGGRFMDEGLKLWRGTHVDWEERQELIKSTWQMANWYDYIIMYVYIYIYIHILAIYIEQLVLYSAYSTYLRIMYIVHVHSYKYSSYAGNIATIIVHWT